MGEAEFFQLKSEIMHLFQRLIQTEADLMRLEEVHSSLFTEHKNLQEDYERIHIYVEVNILVLFSSHIGALNLITELCD